MSTTKTADKAKTATANSSNNLKKVEDQKPQETKTTQTISDLVNPTAESRIKRMENFGILAKKHTFLQNKKNELERFEISQDGTKEKLTLSNANGFVFEVSNTQVMEKVVDLLNGELELFLAQSNKEILSYSI